MTKLGWRMRRLERAHLAEVAEPRRGPGGIGAQLAVDPQPVGPLEGGADDKADDCQPGRPRVRFAEDRQQQRAAARRRWPAPARRRWAPSAAGTTAGWCAGRRRSCPSSRGSGGRRRLPATRQARTAPFTLSSSTHPMPSTPAGRTVATAITPSRDSQEVRHCENARHARSGRPRCAVEATSPPVTRTNAHTNPARPSQRWAGTASSRPSSASQARSPRPAPEAVVNRMTE